MKSIIQSDREHCYLCHRFGETDEHHVIMGNAQRKKAEKYGLKVYLCRTCHRRLHDTNWQRRELERVGQIAFELTFVEEDFMSIFGRNYK